MDKEKSLKIKLKQVLILTLVALSFSKIKTPIMCSKLKTATNTLLYNKYNKFFLSNKNSNKSKKGNTGIEKNLKRTIEEEKKINNNSYESSKEEYLSSLIIENVKNKNISDTLLNLFEIPKDITKNKTEKNNSNETNKNNANININNKNLNKNKHKLSIENFKNNENKEITLSIEKIEECYEIPPNNKKHNKKPDLNKINLNIKEKECLNKATESTNKCKNKDSHDDSLTASNHDTQKNSNKDIKELRKRYEESEKLYIIMQERENLLQKEILKKLENKQKNLISKQVRNAKRFVKS